MLLLRDPYSTPIHLSLNTIIIVLYTTRPPLYNHLIFNQIGSQFFITTVATPHLVSILQNFFFFAHHWAK